MSSEKATVSVIIPVYNSAPWLSECLDSVCSQTLKGTEIICVNDGSTDNSLEILEAYQRQDNRIRIIRQKNSGLSMTRNAGIQVATGKYLYFLDSDDYIDTNALEILAKRMDEDDLQLVFFNTVAFGDDIDNIEFAKEKNANYYHRELDEEAILPGPELFQQLKNKNNFLCNAGVSMIRRDLILDKGLSFHPGALHEDEAWTFSALIFASRCGCVNKIFHHRRYRESSIMRKDISFANAYGRFCAVIDIHKAATIAGLNGDVLNTTIEHTQSIQDTAISNYRACSLAEKEKYLSLPQEQKLLFQQMIVFPANLYDRLDQAQSEQAQMKKELANTRIKLNQFEKSAS